MNRQETALNKADILNNLPPKWAEDLMPEINNAIKARNQKVIVLDDDPTGTQTVHDVTVITGWSVEVLEAELRDPSPAVFVLTNTRSMPEKQARAVNHEIATNLNYASARTGRDFVIVSRSDSTLRGHFPAETDVLARELADKFDGVLIIPAFMAGERYTIHGVHYVGDDERLIPASETPFAKDSAFGYSTSVMRDWVAEKTGGTVHADEVLCIDIDLIRSEGASAVAEQLLTLNNHAYCVMDAVTERDLEVITMAILQAEAQGKRFLYRTAASFAAVRAGITLRPLLTMDELQTGRAGGGLVVVGSYVPKSSAQLMHLLEHSDIHAIEVNVNALLDDRKRTGEIKRVIDNADLILASDQNVVIFTSRLLISGENADSSLNIGGQVSRSLVEIVRGLQVSPRFIVAKGGITSSDLATDALNVQCARVIGQILPGIPVWKLGDESAQPDLIYVVFPGNVGSVSSLTEVVKKFDAAN